MAVKTVLSHNFMFGDCNFNNNSITSKQNKLLLLQKQHFLSARQRIRDVYPTGFHNLPAKVLIQIFQYFDETELRKCIMPVCRKWKNVAQLPELWQKLEFKGLKIPPNFICQQLRILTNLQKLHLFKIPDAVTVIRQICRCSPQLTSVGIKECSEEQPEGKLPESVLRNLVASCKKLQEINLKGTQFCGNMFYLELAVLPDIKSVNLSKNKYLQGRNLLELILNCHSLEELKLTHRFRAQKLSDNDIQFLFTTLRSTLRSLSFDGIDLPDVTFQLILECKNLQKLFLYNAMNMSMDTFIKIGLQLPHLEFLKIQKLTVPSNAFVLLFTQGKNTLNKIKSLNFSDCWRMDTRALNSIAEACPLLEKLVLKNCREIVDVNTLVTKCNKIKHLNLAYCIKIPNKSLMSIPEKLPDLERFFIDLFNEERKLLLAIMKKTFKKLEIIICLSEYNKSTEKLSFFV